MAKQVVTLRLDEELLGWANEYAERRGVPRTALLEEGLRSFREDCERGVPEIRAAAARQAAHAHASAEQGVGQCPDRATGLGHVWAMDAERVNRCRFCGMEGRTFLESATAERAELFSRLRTPESVKGGKRRAGA